MTETIRYSRIGKEDLILDRPTEVVLSDGRVVVLSPVDIAYFLSNAFTLAEVPAALATLSVGELYRLKDSVRGFWGVNQAGREFSLSGQIADVREFGATGSGVSDDRAAIQAAIDAIKVTGGTVLFPPGTYQLGGALLLENTRDFIRLAGVSQGACHIRSALSDVFTITGADHFTIEHLKLTSQVGGGHIFDVAAGGVSRMTLQHLYVTQNNLNKSYWNQPAGTGGYIDNFVQNCWFFGASSNNHSVPLWNIVANNDCNSNTWHRCRFTFSGAYVFQIDNQVASGWSLNNVWRDITWEVTNGGNIRLFNCAGTLIEECNAYDLTVTTEHQYSFGRSPTAGALECRDTVLRQCQRHGGALGSSLADIHVESVGVDRPGILIEHCRVPGSSGFTIDLGSRGAVIIGITADTLLNASGVNAPITRIGDRGVRIGSRGYLNFGTTDAVTGYGIRDNAGTVEFKNSGGTWNPIGTFGHGPEFDAGDSSTAITVDWNNGTRQKVTMTGNATFTLSNPVDGTVYYLRLVQDVTGNRTAAWPVSVKWSGGTPPTLSAGNKTDLISFLFLGGSYHGAAILNY